MSWSSTAAFYGQLKTLLKAGLPIGQALSHAANASGQPHRTLGQQWSAGCQQGRTLSEQLVASAEPPLAIALVKAGETSGTLPELCGEIAGYFNHILALRTMVISRLIYPAMLLHVALLAMAIPWVFMKGGSPLLLLAGPAVLWTSIGVLALVARFISREFLARVALAPGIRGLTWPLVAGNTCLVLRAACSAGMLVPASLDLAADACSHRIVARSLRHAASQVATGRLPTLTAALSQCSFPLEVLQLVGNAEISGTLEDTLGRCTTLEQERFRTRTEWTARIITGTIYGLSMLFAGLVVISFYAGYLNQVNEIANSVGE
jgi:type II secretory pathway component PulF